MQFIPIDQTPARLGQLVFVSLAPKTDREGLQTADRNGVPRWDVTVLLTPPLTASGFQPRPVVESVTLTASEAPEVPALSPVVFRDLTARPYEFKTKGEKPEDERIVTGVSLSATGIGPARTSGGEK